MRTVTTSYKVPIRKVYVFTREYSADGTLMTWTEQAKLYANDPASSDNFGISVSLYGNTALIGASDGDKRSGSGRSTCSPEHTLRTAR